MEQELGFSVERLRLSFIAFWGRYKLLFPFFGGCIVLPLYLIPFLPGYDPSKWLLLYIFSFISLLLMTSNSSLYVPTLNRTQRYILIGLGLSLVFNYFYHGISILGKETVDRMMFWSLFFFFCTYLKDFEFSEKQNLFYALFLGTGFFVVGGFLNFIFIKPQLSFTFGNLNKAAEFVGFSLALQLSLLSSYSKKMQKGLLPLISLSLAYLYFAKCRSVWIGTTCVFIYLLWLKKLPVRTCFYIVLGTLTLTIFFEGVFLIRGELPLNLSAKIGSFNERWHILLNTLLLIFDYPLGVGIGRFNFAAVSYMKNLPQNALNESYPLFSPYNEPLRFLSEEGVIVSILLFLFFVSFIYPFQKLKNLSRTCPESIAFLIFLLIQSSFQYPLKQPVVLFLLPFVLAYTARYTIELHAIKVFLLPWFKGSLGVYFGLATLAMGMAIHLSTCFSPDTRLSQRTYRLWKDQNLLNNILFMSYVSGKYEEIKELTLQELGREPQNLLALKYLGLANVKSGNKKEGCIQLTLYNKAYATPSSVIKEISHYCAK